MSINYREQRLMEDKRYLEDALLEVMQELEVVLEENDKLKRRNRALDRRVQHYLLTEKLVRY